MAPAEFIRGAALSLSANEPTLETAQLSPEVVALIESTHRYAFIVATLKRDELLRDGRGEEVEEAIKLARSAQSSILSGHS